MTSESEHHFAFIRRREERVILDQVDLVRGDGTSRAVLLYGAGGVGKTRLVRGMAEHSPMGSGPIWVPPIDVDDSTYWLLANLEQDIAKTLDPQRHHFGSYFDYLSKLPHYTHRQVGHETIITHLGRIKEIFIKCYRSFVAKSGRTVVITLDTVEALRSMYLLLTITQWMKALPGTLFILAGRPPTGRHGQDAIRDQLSDPLNLLESTEIKLGGFNTEEGSRFLDKSPLAASLDAAERRRLLDLTEGHPLWLTLSLDFLSHADPPAEMTAPGAPGGQEREAFRRRLVAPYRSSDFWPEAIKRLAVVRHSVNQQVWQQLMDDRDLPENVGSWDRAWELLLRQPWVRPRANRRYATLHDALAEELAYHVIPLHDQDESWRSGLWRKAANIYTGLTSGPDQRVQQELERLAGAVQLPDRCDDAELIERVAKLDAQKRELDQLRTAQLYYRLLDNFQAGSDTFLEFYEQARARHDLLFQELICHEMERFLPHDGTAAPLEDVLGVVVGRFHDWLRRQAPVRYIEVGLSIAGFLIRNEQPSSALELLDGLPEPPGKPLLRYRLDNQRGNAAMRIPGYIAQARNYFDRALAQTRQFDSPARERCEAQARKEFGFYFRNLGHWQEADQAYQEARDVMSKILGPGSSDEDREEMASIQTNWAYLQALQGKYQEARNLVESAITVRRRLGRPHNVGVSLSVSGEVYRYGHDFVRAWQDYDEAELIFQELKSWPWLGVVYQEQAICLHQAHRFGVPLPVDQPQKHARTLIRQALDICRDWAIRSYPSALNRAGRIFGAKDVDDGLKYLEKSILEADKITDGRILSVNLVEYIEMCFRAWRETAEQRYRDRIDSRIPEVERVLEEYDFLDMRGRGELLQGHLAVSDAVGDRRQEKLDEAVQHYSRGFAALADERVGSYGSALIAREFKNFRDMFTTLPEEVQSAWYSSLRSDWSAPKSGARSTSLLARLEELY